MHIYTLFVNYQMLHIILYHISNITNRGVRFLAVTFLPIITSSKHHILHVPCTDNDVNVVYRFGFRLDRHMNIKNIFLALQCFTLNFYKINVMYT